MKTVSALFLVLLATACSHPLQISGEGDIVSSNGKHDCLLEEQPCDNFVAGDYAVTYTAQPREGWNFDGWEGCAGQFPECTFDVPGTAVIQNWGEVMPPLKATFSREPARKQVLIIFDNSGSMNIVDQTGDATISYDSDATYPDNGFDNTKVYFSANDSVPTLPTSNYFSADINRCESSFIPLSSSGYFRTKADRWDSGIGWLDLSFFETQTAVHVDCEVDLQLGEEGNGPNQAAGLPSQPVSADAPDDQAYTTAGFSTLSFSGATYTWYSGHYLNWVYSASTEPKNRLEVAKNVVNDVINTNISLDFGLATFNHNSDGALFSTFNCFGTLCPIYNSEEDNGGRIIKHLKENMSAADRTNLAGPNGLINSLSAAGSKPLSETVFEVFLYLSGNAPRYGLKQDALPYDFWAGHDSEIDSPIWDPQAFRSGLARYNSPTTDCASTYVILMTDGLPSRDDDANALVESDFYVTCPEFAVDGGGTAKNCLAEVTRYMANNDLDDNPDNGNQFGITYTIGFNTDQQLLNEAALNGKGQYFTANSSAELAEAYRLIIENISNTSPSITTGSSLCPN